MGNWFYVQDGNRVGPVSEEQLKTLYQAGAIEGDSLIWQKGLKEWVKYDVKFPPPPGAKKPAKKDPPAAAKAPPKPTQPQGATPGPVLSPSAAASPGATNPPPPPAEAFTGDAAPDKGKPGLERAAFKPVPEPKVPKPIPSKGTEERWKTMGPTFQLAGDKKPLGEEETGAATARSAPATPPKEDEAAGTKEDAQDEVPVGDQKPTPDAKSQSVPPPVPDTPETREPAQQPGESPGAKVAEGENLDPSPLKLPSAANDIAIDGPDVERAICHECEKPFPVSMMDRFGRRWVCKLCQARQREKYQQDLDRKRGRKGLFSGTFEKILLVVAIIGLLATVGFAFKGRLMSFVRSTGLDRAVNLTPRLPPTEWVNKPLEDWPPIVMANYTTFAESTPLQGGSAFLVKSSADGPVAGSTSSTLLTTDFGVHPPVHPATIPMFLGDWRMFSTKAPDKVIRFSRLYGDLTAYVESPVLFLEPAQAIPPDYPVEILRIQNRGVSDGEFVYVVTMQPRKGQFVQTIYEGVCYSSEGEGGMNIVVELDETVSDMEVPGAPILDGNGHVVGMIVGSQPFQGHMEIEDFEQVLYNREKVTEVERRRDVRQVSRLYAVDLRMFPDTLEK